MKPYDRVRLRAIVLTIIFELLGYMLHAQGVGIGTSYPKATLHVAGTVRVDSARVISRSQRFAVFDSVGEMRSLMMDSLKNQLGLLNYQSKEVIGTAGTTSSSPQSRVTLTLDPGIYIVFAYCEVFNTSVDAGTRVWLHEGSTEIAFGVAYSNTSTFGSWTAFRVVNPTAITSYVLSYSSWPAGTTSQIRRVRLCAIKII